METTATTSTGNWPWGWLADRFGRRANHIGFVAAAAAIAAYLFIDTSVAQLRMLEIFFGLMLPASVIWGPWRAEMYPALLRSTAASIFDWARIISPFSPLATAALASYFGLAFAMSTAILGFLFAAIIWRSLSETLERRSGDPRT